ncbi:MAG: lysophospholipid acyltransferase family protein [Thermomicrobiales bacterium]
MMRVLVVTVVWLGMAGVKWGYWGFKLAFWAAPKLPRWLGYRLTAVGGELYFWLFPSHSHKAVENYAIILADDVASARVRLAARRSFRNYAKSLFDFFRQAATDPDAIEADTVVIGFEHLDAALTQGHGAIVIVPHFGNWDNAGGLLAARGYPTVTVVDRFSPPELDRLVQATRERTGLGIIPPDKGSLRKILQTLRRGQVVGILPDGPQPDGGVEVSFFGQPAWLPAGPARFALRARAPLLFGYVGRRPGDYTYFGIVEPAIAFTPSGDEAADIRALTQLWVERLENLLRQYPEQWYMFRQMWPGKVGRSGSRAVGQ